MAVAERYVQTATPELLHTNIGDVHAMGGAMSDAVEFEMLQGLKQNTTIGIMPFAGAEPQRTYTAYKEILCQNGFQPDVIFREDSQNSATNTAKLDQWTQLFLTGGNQQRIFDYLRDTQLLELIKKRHRNGLRIVTTSAGTAALGVMSPYSFGNFDDDDPEIDGRAFADARCVLRSSTDKQTDLLIPALGLVPGAIFDSHFSQMNRLQRLKAGIEEFPQYVGIGIDENTGVHIVHGDECRVYGANQVFVVKSDGTQTQALPFNSGESFTLSQFR